MADEIELLRLFGNAIPGPSTDAWARARAAVAAARAEEEPAGPPPKRRRGRRWLVPAAGGACAAAAVAGLVVVLLPASPPGAGSGGRQAEEAAYVVSRVQHVLSSPAQQDVIGYARTVLPPGSDWMPGAGKIGSGAGSGARSPGSIGSAAGWWYRGTEKTSGFSATGQRVLATRTSTAEGVVTTFVVNYRDRTWWHESSAAPARPGSPGCDPAAAIRTGDWPAFLRRELRCGAYRVQGRQTVDGIGALRMLQRSGSVTLWVDPATYLPVRLVTGGQQGIRTDFRWLPATSSRLDQLHLPIPAGFRQVSPPS